MNQIFLTLVSTAVQFYDHNIPIGAMHIPNMMIGTTPMRRRCTDANQQRHHCTAQFTPPHASRLLCSPPSSLPYIAIELEPTYERLGH